MYRKIPPRPGVEVYLNEAGHVCLRQENAGRCGESVIVLDPSMVPCVIRFLRETIDDYLDAYHGSTARSGV
jgi:hypothetical protein